MVQRFIRGDCHAALRRIRRLRHPLRIVKDAQRKQCKRGGIVRLDGEHAPQLTFRQVVPTLCQQELGPLVLVAHRLIFRYSRISS